MCQPGVRDLSKICQATCNIDLTSYSLNAMPTASILTRRDFLRLSAGATLAATATSSRGANAGPSRYKAVVFDAFPIFDPRPVVKLAEEVFPGAGSALMTAWRSRQFEYQWLRTLGGQYVDFLRATEDSLVFAARQTGLELTPEKRATLMDAYRHLTVWPDAAENLQRLHDAGLRLGFLSNMTKAALETGLVNARLRHLFEHMLSTDELKTYKPAPAAYQMALDAFRLPRTEILFVAFAGWDAAGSKWFGYPTYWLNRAGSAVEELGATPDGTGPDLAALVKFATGA